MLKAVLLQFQDAEGASLPDMFAIFQQKDPKEEQENVVIG